MSSSPVYTLVNSPQSINQALSALSSSEYLIVDCEARELGGVGGALSLLSIGTANAEQVFLFDALAPAVSPRSKHPAMREVLSLLEREDVLKIMWDGRMDNVELIETYGTRLNGVLDLQLVEVATRATIRGEDENRRLGRLAGLLTPRQVFGNRAMWQDIHLLRGLDSCIRELKIETNYTKDEEVVRMHRANGSAIWMERPLQARLLAYAASDIHAIDAVFQYFSSAGYFSPDRTATFFEQSARYVSIHQGRGRIVRDDPYRSGSFVPLDILTAPTKRRALCKGCQRSLSRQHFLSQSDTQSGLCRVCAALDLKRSIDAGGPSHLPRSSSSSNGARNSKANPRASSPASQRSRAQKSAKRGSKSGSKKAR